MITGRTTLIFPRVPRSFPAYRAPIVNAHKTTHRYGNRPAPDLNRKPNSGPFASLWFATPGNPQVAIHDGRPPGRGALPGVHMCHSEARAGACSRDRVYLPPVFRGVSTHDDGGAVWAGATPAVRPV